MSDPTFAALPTLQREHRYTSPSSFRRGWQRWRRQRRRVVAVVKFNDGTWALVVENASGVSEVTT